MGALILGTDDIDAIELGAVDVAKVMLGSGQVWPPDFPVYVDDINQNLSQSSPSFPLPSYAAGDLLIVQLSRDANTGNAFAIPGWTILEQRVVNSRRICLAWKIATGSEGSTQTFTQSGTATTRSLCVSVRGATKLAWTGPATGNSSAPDPPSLTPGAKGARNYFYYALYIGDGVNTNTGVPSGYTGTTTGSGSYKGAYKQSANATEDPGAFATNNAENWAAYTLALWR